MFADVFAAIVILSCNWARGIGDSTEIRIDEVLTGLQPPLEMTRR
jgi:hypothetical protein